MVKKVTWYSTGAAWSKCIVKEYIFEKGKSLVFINAFITQDSLEMIEWII